MLIISTQSRLETTGQSENLWRIYGLGEIGINEGQICTTWIIDQLSEPLAEARLERHGLDFGYTNDPSAPVDTYRWNGGFSLDEGLYLTGQSNPMLANIIRFGRSCRLRSRTASTSAAPAS
jgi:phage terminase large subunit